MTTYTIYSDDDCPECEEAKRIIGEGNYVEYGALGLINGTSFNLEAMTQLAMQNMELPVIANQNGEFITLAELRLQRNISNV